MPHTSAPPSPPRRRTALLGSAALAGLAVAAAVWLASRPALDLLEEHAGRDLATGMAVLRLAEASGRLVATAPLLAEARTGEARLAAHAELRAQARNLVTLASEIGRTSLNRATAEELRRPLAGVEGEIEDLDRAADARITVETELRAALAKVPERHAALRAALAPLTGEALLAGPRAAGLLGLRDAIAERAQGLADRLLAAEDAEAFLAEARALEGLLARLPIGPASVGRAEAARQLMALGLDTGNVFELRREQARLGTLIAGLTRTGRAKAEEVSQLARRAAEALDTAARTGHADATALLHAAPAAAGALTGLAVLGIAGRRRAEPAPAPPAPEPLPEAAGETAGLRILLAEDERLTQAMAAALLRRAGHTVTVVGDGAAALEAARSERFDLVLLDLRMPEMDGVEALRNIRALPDRAKASVRTVVLTASTVPEDAERCRAAGADAVLAKPLRLDALLPVLEGVAPSAAPEEVPVFDADALDQMLDALPAERVATLVGGTIRALGEYRAALRSARTEGNRATVAAMAHKMAGVAGVYGCPALRQAAQALERGVETGCGDVAELADALDGAYEPAIAALERAMETLPTRSGAA